MSISVYCVQTITAACCFGSLPADPPRITTDPREIKDAVPGNLVAFTIQATGMEPLNYQWEYKIGDGDDVERIPGTNSSTLTIPSVQKSNEGSYCCTVSNCAGSETSQCATLTVGKENTVYLCIGSVSSSTHWTLIFIAVSVVPGHNSSEHISIFIVCKQSQQHAVLVPLQLTPPELPLTHVR